MKLLPFYERLGGWKAPSPMPSELRTVKAATNRMRVAMGVSVSASFNSEFPGLGGKDGFYISALTKEWLSILARTPR